jgi:hypothetical protein
MRECAKAAASCGGLDRVARRARPCTQRRRRRRRARLKGSMVGHLPHDGGTGRAARSPPAQRGMCAHGRGCSGRGTACGLKGSWMKRAAGREAAPVWNRRRPGRRGTQGPRWGIRPAVQGGDSCRALHALTHGGSPRRVAAAGGHALPHQDTHPVRKNKARSKPGPCRPGSRSAAGLEGGPLLGKDPRQGAAWAALGAAAVPRWPVSAAAADSLGAAGAAGLPHS